MPTMAEGFECIECSEGNHRSCNGEAHVEWDNGDFSEVPCRCADHDHTNGGQSA